jgi:1,4-alpha-glucan branching enzyme
MNYTKTANTKIRTKSNPLRPEWQDVTPPNARSTTRIFSAPRRKRSSVSLVGDFNEWKPEAMPMRQMPDGRWMIGMELHHGHHQYVFLVDGKPQLDPTASGIARNERNERVSLTAVS